MKKFSTLFLVSLLSGAVTLGAYKLLFDTNGYFSNHSTSGITTATNSYGKKIGLSADILDFTDAAEKTIHTVVHVKTFPEGRSVIQY